MSERQSVRMVEGTEEFWSRIKREQKARREVRPPMQKENQPSDPMEIVDVMIAQGKEEEALREAVEEKLRSVDISEELLERVQAKILKYISQQ